MFVANPNKPPEIARILKRNKERLLVFLKDFHNDKEGEYEVQCRAVLEGCCRDAVVLRQETGRAVEDHKEAHRRGISHPSVEFLPSFCSVEFLLTPQTTSSTTRSSSCARRVSTQ